MYVLYVYKRTKGGRNGGGRGIVSDFFAFFCFLNYYSLADRVVGEGRNIRMGYPCGMALHR
jgi:hypothetical protein